MRPASKELETEFYNGFELDKKMGKISTRLLHLHREKNQSSVKQTMIDIIMAPKVQSGLLWAVDNNVSKRSIEALALKFKEDFDDAPRDFLKMAEWRLQLARSLKKVA